jgi:hypothetical protein
VLVDASYAFNEQNRIEMLWEVRHEWPFGARFVFNCYKHWAVLVLHGNDGLTVIFSREGVTQGDPLSMFDYGIGILSLIRQLKAANRAHYFAIIRNPQRASQLCVSTISRRLDFVSLTSRLE